MSDWYRRLWDAQGLYRYLSAALAPAEWAFRLGVSVRGWAYERGLFRSGAAPIPTLTVGNLTVGGTGKTPLTAWLARRLASRGHSPAVVMRGYGGDEVEVHRALNPAVPVFVSANRLAGVRRAESAGADVALLDDAFQHRALTADANLVLLAAEQWSARPHLLPRGPWREPLTALKRASLAVVTRKAATVEESRQVTERLRRLRPTLPVAQAHLRLSGIARYPMTAGGPGESRPLSGFECRLALAGVANSDAFWAQLAEAGVTAARRLTFPDHHRYRQADIERIRREAGGGIVLMTLKDAVKLGRALGGDVEIHVPWQEVVWEAGAEQIDHLLGELSARRRTAISNT